MPFFSKFSQFFASDSLPELEIVLKKTLLESIESDLVSRTNLSTKRA